MKCFIWLFWRWARQLLRPFSWGGNLPIMRWHMPDNHCSINACSMCIWQVCCWVCPPVVRLGFYILHPHIISLQVPSLYGMAAASRRVIGYWADCFACGPFFRPFVVSFFFFFFSEPPTLPSRLLFTCTWMQSARTQNNHSHCFHFGLFGSFLDLFSFPTHILHIQRRLTAPTVTVEGVTFPVEQLKRLLYSIILQILCAHADRLKWPGWARW